MPDKNFSPEQRPVAVASIVSGLAVLLGIAVYSFGFWLAWHPLGYIVGGLSASTLGVILGRRAHRSVGRQS